MNEFVVGCLGFLLAVAIFIWQVRVRRAEHREQVSVDLSMVLGSRLLWKDIDERQWNSMPKAIRDAYPASGLHLNVVNTGRVPIYINKVALCSGDESGALGTALNAFRFTPSQPGDDRLEPSQGRLFVLPITFKVDEKPAEEQVPTFWIVVRSTKGELYREEAAHISDYVRQCAAANVLHQKGSSGSQATKGLP